MNPDNDSKQYGAYSIPFESIAHVEHFGNLGTDELDILEEECAELIQACSKVRRSRNGRKNGESLKDPNASYDDLVNEMADVYLIMNHVRFQYGISVHELQDALNKKLERYGLDIHPPERIYASSSYWNQCVK